MDGFAVSGTMPHAMLSRVCVGDDAIRMHLLMVSLYQARCHMHCSVGSVWVMMQSGCTS
jgi:hypothetical protein